MNRTSVDTWGSIKCTNIMGVAGGEKKKKYKEC